MKIEMTFLRSKLARRIFILFVFCALLPVGILAVVSFSHVTNQLKAHGHNKLQKASKSAGMAIYEKLLFLESEMDLFASNIDIDSSYVSTNKLKLKKEDLKRRYNRLGIVTPTHRLINLLGKVQKPRGLSEAETDHLHTGMTLLLTEDHPCHGSL